MSEDEAPASPRPPLSSAATALLASRKARAYFFPLVRYLERLTQSEVRVGGDGPYHEEPIRFRNDPSLNFASVDVVSIQTISEKTDAWDAIPREKFELVSTFLGLSGAPSPLPAYMVEEIAHDDSEPPVLRDFVDLFHHRMLSFLYRLTARLDHPSDYLTGGRDSWSKRIQALVGVDAFGGEQTGLPVDLLLRLAPVLATGTRSARALELALREALRDEVAREAVRVRAFMGAWAQVDPRERIALGIENTHLGRNMMLGTRAFDRAGKFRIEIGPVAQEVYQRFQRGGDLMKRVSDLVAIATPGTLDWDLAVTFGAGAQPGLPLSRLSRAGLGRDTWLKGREQAEAQVVIAPAA